MTMVMGVLRPGCGDGKNWEAGLMKSIRELTGFSYLIPGTLNVHVNEPRHVIRPDHVLTAESNVDRGEAVTFERCRIWCAGTGIRALFIRTSTDTYSEHKILEFMAERRLRELFKLVDEDKIQIEFFNTEADAVSKTNDTGVIK
jgi:CTP-dependent riboflavin kinase